MVDSPMIGYIYDPRTGEHRVRVALAKPQTPPRCTLCRLRRGTIRLRGEVRWICHKCALDVPVEQLGREKKEKT